MTDLNQMFGLSGGKTPSSAQTPQADYSGARAAHGPDLTAHREWASRKDDERYCSMVELDEHLATQRAGSTEVTFKLADIRPEIDGDKLGFVIPGYKGLLEPTNHAFGQLCSKIRAPADYVRRLPNDLAVKCLQFGFDASEVGGEEAVALVTDLGQGPKLRATTTTGYGRIWDSQLSGAVRRLTEETNNWQVPIAFHKPGDVYNPVVALDVTKNATTLYSGDRDTFIYLCDQTKPIEAGRLPDGSPRLFFRGFICWNSEVGTRKIGVKTFLYEMTCANRMIWGQAGVEEVSRRHTKLAPEEFVTKIVPALKAYIDGGVTGIEQGLLKLQRSVVAENDEQRLAYLYQCLELGPVVAGRLLKTIEEEEGHPMETVFDCVQGLTAMARSIANQDRRLEAETMAGDLMKRYAAA